MSFTDWQGMVIIVSVLGAFGFVWARIFGKAGYPRWWAVLMFVPLLNLFWVGRLFTKAGYSAWWALTIFVPLLNIGMILNLAFSEWPPHPELR
jgi:hypothetical protein